MVAINDPTEHTLVIKEVFTEYAISLLMRLSVRLYPERILDNRNTSERAMAASAATPRALTARTMPKSVESCKKVWKCAILP